jgi:hypothetical protein
LAAPLADFSRSNERTVSQREIARPESKLPRTCSFQRLLLAVANFRSHAALFTPQLSPTFA